MMSSESARSQNGCRELLSTGSFEAVQRAIKGTEGLTVDVLTRPSVLSGGHSTCLFSTVGIVERCKHQLFSNSLLAFERVLRSRGLWSGRKWVSTSVRISRVRQSLIRGHCRYRVIHSIRIISVDDVPLTALAENIFSNHNTMKYPYKSLDNFCPEIFQTKRERLCSSGATSI